MQGTEAGWRNSRQRAGGFSGILPRVLRAEIPKVAQENEQAMAHPLMSEEGASTLLWTAQLEVFEQDFDTAMAIWSVEDASVGRLFANEVPMTRRRRNVTNSQVEFSQLSELSQASSTQSRGKKRRRMKTADEGRRGLEAPPAPLSGQPPTQELAVTQMLSFEGVGASSNYTDTQESLREECSEHVKMHPVVEGEQEGPSAPTAGANVSMPAVFEDACMAPTGPACRDAADKWESHTSQLGSTADQDVRVSSAFSTGSGRPLSISRKRLRDYETEFRSDYRSTSVIDANSEDAISTPASSSILADESTDRRDQAPEIDPRRLSFSSVANEYSQVSTSGFTTGSGRKLQQSPSALRKYESLLFSDEISTKSTKTALIELEEAKPTPEGKYRHDSSCAREGFPTDTCAGTGWTTTAFQTGAGRCVTVSDKKLSLYAQEFLLENNVGDGEQVVSGDAVRSDSCATVLRTAGALSDFQTASGRSVIIPEERLKAIEGRLFAEDQLTCGSSDNQEASQYPGVASVDSREEPGQVPANSVGSSFQTRSGISLHVSQDKVLKYTREFGDEADKSASGGAEKATVVGAFTTGRGAQVCISQEFLRKYETLLDEEVRHPADKRDTSCHQRIEEHLMSPSIGFISGSGKKVSVSKEKLLEFEEKMMDVAYHEVSSVAQSKVELGASFSSASGRRISISEEKLREYEKKFAADTRDLAENAEIGATKIDCSVSSGAILAGFTTGNGRCVSVSEDKLREYEGKVLGGLDEPGPRKAGIDSSMRTSSNGRSGLGSPTQDSASRLRKGQKSRRSTGSVVSMNDLPTANRRHSLPPRHQVKSSEERATPAVSSGVIRRMSIANKKQSRPVLDDLSNTFNERRLTGGEMSTEKVRMSQESQEISSARYLTPAKQRSSKAHNLSAKKGFRPPLPSKTPPSKSIVTPTRSFSSQPTKSSDSAKTPVISIAMPFVEAMRISHKLLVAESANDSQSYLSGPRARILCQITPESAPAVVFSANDDLLDVMDKVPSDAMTMNGIYVEMKQRGWIGEDSAVSIDWFRNHYRWVVWKLALMELRSPRYMFGRYLTKSQVMYQLCKRYERDVVLAQRSVLKKILNRDANAASCLVLRVAAALPYPVEEETDVDIVPPPHWKLAVVLTDGWYGVYGVPDSGLAELMWKQHKAGKLVGMKIVTWSATLQNLSDGIDPMECAIAGGERWSNPLSSGKDEPSKWPYLKLHLNSTRPAHRDTRLGLENLTRITVGRRQSDASYDFVLLKSIPMRSLEVGGGLVRSVCIRVTRVSPVLHLQSKDFSIGPRILCEEHMPQYLQARQEYLLRMKCEANREDETTSPTLPLPVPFVKLDVECAHKTSTKGKCFAVLTVWRPGEDLLLQLREGGTYFATSLSINWKVDYGTRGVFMRVGTTKGSTFEVVESSEAQLLANHSRNCSIIEDLIINYQRHVDEMPKEKKMLADVCVVIIRFEESKPSCAQNPEAAAISSTDHVFATDRSGRLISIQITSTRAFKPSSTDLAEVPLMTMKQNRVFARGNKKLWSEGNVVCISGLEVSHFDEKLGVLDCDLVESTQIVSLPSKRSHFYDDAQALRGMLADQGNTSAESRELLRRLRMLKKHVERKILLLDFSPTQDDEEGSVCGGDSNEVEHLTHDLHSQLESDTGMWMSQMPLVSVDGVVAKILPVDENEVRSGVQDMAAIAYVRSVSNRDDEGSMYAFYLSGEMIGSARELLESSEDCDRILHFEAQWETNERLLNSWKPWERDGSATFLVTSNISEVRSRKES